MNASYLSSSLLTKPTVSILVVSRVKMPVKASSLKSRDTTIKKTAMQVLVILNIRFQICFHCLNFHMAGLCEWARRSLSKGYYSEHNKYGFLPTLKSDICVDIPHKYTNLINLYYIVTTVYSIVVGLSLIHI